MKLPFAAAPSERRLLADTRSTGPMPWVLAIMVFLTLLAAAAGLALATAAGGLSEQVAGRVTIRIAEADRPTREALAQAALAAARTVPVRQVRRVPDAELDALVAPWLGENTLDLPQPALIDVDLADAAALPRLAAAVRRVAPGAAIDAHAQALAPLKRLIDALRTLAIALILLTGVATAASVVLAARAALNTHRETIDVLHLLGATDLQIARLFQRRIALDALIGGALGFVAGAAVLLLLGRQVAALGSGLTSNAALATAEWLVLLLVPLAAALLATLVARLTIERALRLIL